MVNLVASVLTDFPRVSGLIIGIMLQPILSLFTLRC